MAEADAHLPHRPAPCNTHASRSYVISGDFGPDALALGRNTGAKPANYSWSDLMDDAEAGK